MKWFKDWKERQRARQNFENWRQWQYQKELNTLFQMTVKKMEMDEPIIRQHLDRGLCRLPYCDKKQFANYLCEEHNKDKRARSYKRILDRNYNRR